MYVVELNKWLNVLMLLTVFTMREKKKLEVNKSIGLEVEVWLWIQ